eukprot:5489675-Pyramimonas_sp.AAC.1
MRTTHRLLRPLWLRPRRHASSWNIYRPQRADNGRRLYASSPCAAYELPTSVGLQQEVALQGGTPLTKERHGSTTSPHCAARTPRMSHG